MTLKVFKMHGAGNDFVIIDKGDIAEERLPDLAIRLCDRHFGVGADGLLVISETEDADAQMRIINSDGTEAQMCGNGIRCIGKYLYDSRLISTLHPKILTGAGLKYLQLHPGTDGKIERVTVDMGEATKLSESKVELTVEAGNFLITPVSTGNPHCVVEVDDVRSFDVTNVGPQLENHPYWPEKTNVEFVTAISEDTICQRTWERGVGETLACGTGACAAAYALATSGKVNWPVRVMLPGGTLTINIEDGHLMMTGPAAMVFEASLSL